jgi:hypothetical protein
LKNQKKTEFINSIKMLKRGKENDFEEEEEDEDDEEIRSLTHSIQPYYFENEQYIAYFYRYYYYPLFFQQRFWNVTYSV